MVAQRTEFFGLMRCVGATPKQIMKFVRKEALNWCKFAIPIGIITGVLIIWILCALLLRPKSRIFFSHADIRYQHTEYRCRNCNRNIDRIISVLFSSKKSGKSFALGRQFRGMLLTCNLYELRQILSFSRLYCSWYSSRKIQQEKLLFNDNLFFS